MTPCIEFSGLRNKNGYGQVWTRDKYMSAHRFAYCVSNGVLPEEIKDLVIRHACDNPSCINPTHLCVGTHQDNMNDMVERKRQAMGNRSGKAKLTEIEVKEILNIYIPRDKDFGAKPLSKIFNVTAGQIAKIGRGEKWAYLSK